MIWVFSKWTHFAWLDLAPIGWLASKLAHPEPTRVWAVFHSMWLGSNLPELAIVYAAIFGFLSVGISPTRTWWLPVSLQLQSCAKKMETFATQTSKQSFLTKKNLSTQLFTARVLLHTLYKSMFATNTSKNNFCHQITLRNISTCFPIQGFCYSKVDFPRFLPANIFQLNCWPHQGRGRACSRR